MRTITRLIWVLALCLSAALFAQVTNNSTKSGAPNPPAAPRPAPGQLTTLVDAATTALNPGLLRNVTLAHDAWKQTGGAEFMPSLNFVGGKPILMLVTRPTE